MDAFDLLYSDSNMPYTPVACHTKGAGSMEVPLLGRKGLITSLTSLQPPNGPGQMKLSISSSPHKLLLLPSPTKCIPPYKMAFSPPCSPFPL